MAFKWRSWLEKTQREKNEESDELAHKYEPMLRPKYPDGFFVRFCVPKAAGFAIQKIFVDDFELVRLMLEFGFWTDEKFTGKTIMLPGPFHLSGHLKHYIPPTEIVGVERHMPKPPVSQQD